MFVTGADNQSCSEQQRRSRNRSRARRIGCAAVVACLLVAAGGAYVVVQGRAFMRWATMASEMAGTLSKQDLPLAEALLRAGADPDTAGHNDSLRYAIERNDQRMILLLLRYHAKPNITRGRFSDYNGAMVALGADVNERDRFGETPLISASVDGVPNMVEFLLRHDADPRMRDTSGATAIERLARAERDHPERAAAYTVARDLLQAALASTRSPSRASARPTFAVAARASRDGELLEACARGDTARAALLLSQGASVHARNERAWTPLICAAGAGDPESVQRLVAAGSDVNAAGIEGITPLWAAAADLGPIRRLATAVHVRADGTFTDSRSREPARQENAEAIVRCLIDHGALVTARTGWDSSAIQAAAEAGDVATVRVLVAHGADLRRDGAAAFDFAVTRGHLDVVRYLLNKGVSVNAKAGAHGIFPYLDQSAGSLLMAAVHGGHWDVAKLLIARGADVNVRSKDGMTPLGLALGQNDEVVRLLREAGARDTDEAHMAP